MLGEADFLLHPSVSELLPMSVIEAMSAGLPVVASDIVGDLVREKESGFVVPVDLPEPERVKLIRQAVTLLLADDTLRVKMGQIARERAVAEFSWETVAARVLRVYERARAD